MLVFEERGKPEHPEKNLSEQGKEPTTNSTHILRQRRDLNPDHIGGRPMLSPLRMRHPCSPNFRLHTSDLTKFELRISDFWPFRLNAAWLDFGSSTSYFLLPTSDFRLATPLSGSTGLNPRQFDRWFHVIQNRRERRENNEAANNLTRRPFFSGSPIDNNRKCHNIP